MLQDGISNACNFRQTFLLVLRSNRRYNNGTQVIKVIWQTVVEYVVADTFCSYR